MIFSVNQTEFPSVIHKAIWNEARRIFPLGQNPDPDCADLYNFTLGAYADMYNSPEIYGLDPDEAKNFLQHRRWQQAIILATIKEDKPAMRFFDRAARRVNFVRFLATCLETKTPRFQAQDTSILKRLSFEITPAGDGAVLTNTKYPRMFSAIAKLNDVAKNQKTSHKNVYSAACQFLDFRVLLPDYTCSFEDALYSLDDENKRYIIRLDDFLSSMGIKKVCRLNTVEWVKGKTIVTYNGMKRHFDITKQSRVNDLITVAFGSWGNRWEGEHNQENRLKFEQIINSKPNANELQAFCKKSIKRCTECGCRQWGPPPHGTPKILFDKTVRTCSGSTHFGVENLNQENFDIIADLIKARIEMGSVK